MRHRSDPSAADPDEPGALWGPGQHSGAGVLGSASDASASDGPVSDESAPGDRHRGDGGTAGPSGLRSGRVRVGVGAVVILLIAAAVVAVLLSAAAQRGDTVALGAATGDLLSPAGSTAAVATGSATASPGASAAGRVLVHVAGAVRTPGIVSLATGARVVDAVAAAGGLTEDANPSGINLARPVADGEQLLVPRVGEVPQAPAAAGGAMDSGGAVVNLNTATAAELEALPRIGPALAQRILDWRQANGRFSPASDLLKVSGIGQKLFDGLKDRVVV